MLLSVINLKRKIVGVFHGGTIIVCTKEPRLARTSRRPEKLPHWHGKTILQVRYGAWLKKNDNHTKLKKKFALMLNSVHAIERNRTLSLRGQIHDPPYFLPRKRTVHGKLGVLQN